MKFLQKINEADKVSLHKWLQRVFFTLYDWNAGPVRGNNMSLSVVAIDRELPSPIDISPENSRKGTSEVQQHLDHFEDAYPLLFRQRELFNIPISGRRLRYMELHSKVNITKELYTGDIVVVINQVKPIRKDRVDHTLSLKTKRTYIFLGEGYTKIILVAALAFL